MNQDQPSQSLSGLALMLIIALMLVANSLMSCRGTKYIAHTPSKRDINRAMSYSTWEYAQPEVSTGHSSKSRFKHAVVVLDK